MNTPIRTIRLSNKDWSELLKLAKMTGYKNRSSFILAIIHGEVEICPKEEITRDSEFDWGA